MLKPDLSAKTIAIIGVHSLTAKIILKTLVAIPTGPILALTVTQSKPKVESLLNHSYFKSEEQRRLKDKLVFLDIKEVEKYL